MLLEILNITRLEKKYVIRYLKKNVSRKNMFSEISK